MAEKSKKEYNANIEGMEATDLMGLIEAALDHLPIENFSAVIANAEAIRRTKEQEAKDALIREFRERTAKLGLSMSDLFPAKATRKERKDSGTTPAVRYRSPNGEGWSGRGLTPKWIKALEKEGRNREEFRVQEQSAAQPA